MIIVSYIYDFEQIFGYRRQGDEGREIVLPRQDEFVDVDDTVYRVETITHVFTKDAYDSEQQIIIKLTRQLAIRSI